MSFDFNVNWADLIPGLIKVVAIVAVVLVIIFILRRIIPRIIKARIPKIREESQEQLAARSDTLSGILVQVTAAVIWVIAVIMILSVLGVNIGPLIAAVGVVGLALGFAAQNIIRDYLHGFFIIMEDWYRVGEAVVISGIAGGVDNITLRRTILRDLDGTMHDT